MAAKSAKNFFFPNLFLFVLAGIWSPYYYDQATSFRKRAYAWYHRFLVAVCLLYLLQCIAEFHRVSPELTIDDISEFYSYLVQLLTGLLKKYFLQRNEAKMRKLFREIEGPPFHRTNDPVFDSKLRQRTRTTYKIMALFWIPIYATVIVKLVNVAFESQANKALFLQECGDDRLALWQTNATATAFAVDCSSYPKMVTPWIAWFPFATDKSPGNQLSITYHMVVLTIFAPYIFNCDMYIATWMMYIAFQFELMEHDLATLRERSERAVSRRITDPECYEQLVTRQMTKGIRRVIGLHSDILGLFRHVQRSLSVILIVQYFWISILICMLLIQMTENPPTSMMFLSASGFLFVAINQIFVVFYYCNEVKVHSLRIPMAAFHCGWHLCGAHSYQLRNYVMFLIRITNRELNVLAGGLFSVDMGAFLKVIKASYSYFALINSRHK